MKKLLAAVLAIAILAGGGFAWQQNEAAKEQKAASEAAAEASKRAEQNAKAMRSLYEAMGK